VNFPIFRLITFAEMAAILKLKTLQVEDKSKSITPQGVQLESSLEKESGNLNIRLRF